MNRLAGSSRLAKERLAFHRALLEGVLTLNDSGIASNADGSSRLSIKIAAAIAEQLQGQKPGRNGLRLAGQTSGNRFEALTANFVRESFAQLQHLRPGSWLVEQVTSRNRRAIAEFEQYAHLTALDEAAKRDPQLAAALGSDYTISPDVVVIRQLVTDDEINRPALWIDETVANRAALRSANGGKPLLHASISTKWTIRSDRSQNSRTEALNLMRNRKGRVPHIMVVTGEPLPSRLASIALGTGEIDCVYHFALTELIAAIENCGEESALDSLNVMLDGKRLKDIADLPLDLAV
jgi:NgoMIV restriction enzyme